MAENCVVEVIKTFDLQPKNNNILASTELKEKPEKQDKNEVSVNDNIVPRKMDGITKRNGFSKPVVSPSNSLKGAVLRSVMDKKQAVQSLGLNKQFYDDEW
mgnify:CR=1 FL=1